LAFQPLTQNRGGTQEPQSSSAGGKSGEWRRDAVGKRVEGEAGEEWNPFWGLVREDAHQDVRSTVRQLGGGELTVAGQKRGGERW
jgi:hypothetical protein